MKNVIDEKIVEIALGYYINSLKAQMADMLNHGEDIGFLETYIKRAEKEIMSLSEQKAEALRPGLFCICSLFCAHFPLKSVK